MRLGLGRVKDASCPTPPAQIRAGAANAGPALDVLPEIRVVERKENFRAGSLLLPDAQRSITLAARPERTAFNHIPNHPGRWRILKYGKA